MTAETARVETVIGRRTIIQGAAWSVPVIAVAAAAPAFAASGGPVADACDGANTGTTSTVVQGTWGPETGLVEEGGAYETDFTPTGFQSYWNNESLTSETTFTATYTFTATKSTDYLISFDINTSPGNGIGGAMGSAAQGVVVTAGSETLASVRTHDRTDYSAPAWWDPSSTPVAAPYFSALGGPVTITFTFTLAPRGGASEGGTDATVNDDIIVTTPTVVQTGCGA